MDMPVKMLYLNGENHQDFLLIISKRFALYFDLFFNTKISTVCLLFLKAQFHITKYDQGVINNTTNRLIESGFRNDSVAFLHFFFERQTGFFLLQVFFIK